MSRELRQLLADLSAKQGEASTLMAKDGVTKDELNAKLGEVQAIQAKIEMQKAIDSGKEFNADGVEITGKPADAIKKEKAENKATYQSAFMNAFRNRATTEDFKILNALNPSTPADGGLIVPSDIQTAINLHKRTLPMLESLINVVPVGTAGGSRVFEKIATMIPFAPITDLAIPLTDMGSPQFESVIYAIKDYGGTMPIPNDLLNDTDQNLMAYIVGWIARKSVVTRNGLISTLLTALTPSTFADWKKIKKAINITLDPIFAASASIITNQDGFQYLDTLIDGQSRPLLQPDASRPGGNVLFGKPIIVVSNGTIVTTGTTTKLAPMFIGNLQEAITMFERQGHSIASTNVGGTAFQTNQTQVRAIEREDIKTIDAAAVVYGQIDVTSVLA